MKLVDFNQTMKDYYPRPGERLKQYVVDERIAGQWDVETCPRVELAAHIDNTGVECHERGAVPYVNLWAAHCCSICGDAHEAARERADVKAWMRRRDTERPKICEDRTKLSNEIAPDLSLRESPMLALISKRGAR